MSDKKIPMKPDVVFMNPRSEVPGNGGKSEAVTIHFELEFSPSDKARFAISSLASDPELTRNYMLGEPPTPEMVAENERRNELYLERYVAIIKKHGVQEEYLKPLIERRNRLWSELVKINQDIEAIRA